MRQHILIKLCQPNAAGMCVFEDSTGEWEGMVFVPLAALSQMLGEPFAYFAADVDPASSHIVIGDRVADLGWSAPAETSTED